MPAPYTLNLAWRRKTEMGADGAGANSTCDHQRTYKRGGAEYRGWGGGWGLSEGEIAERDQCLRAKPNVSKGGAVREGVCDVSSA